MLTLPNSLSQKSLLFFFLGCLGLLAACKSAVPVPETPPALPSQSAPVKSSTSDSLAYLQLLREKQADLNAYQPSRKRYMDILHTELDLSFDYGRSAVEGQALLSLKPYVKPVKTVVLDAKDFELGEIKGKVNGEEFKPGYAYDEKQLTIYLPAELEVEDTLSLSIRYTAFPDRNAGKGGTAITDTKGLYFIDPMDTIASKPRMIWTQGETSFNSKWFPTIDSPNERFTQKIHLSVADSLVTISNGLLTAQEDLGNGFRKDTWELTTPHAPYLAAVVVGDFGKIEDQHREIPLGYYVEKGYEKGAQRVFQHTPEMMEYFEELLGVSFPWPKYDQIVVRDFVSGAMENTTASIFMEELRLTEREAIDSEWDYIIAHELFHQWFGDYVTTESWANLTLNEAFANYSEYLWNEYKYGVDEAKLKLTAERDTYFQEAEAKQVDLIRYHYDDPEEMFDAHSYSKGGLILHMLRGYLGDSVFFESLNYYLTEHALSAVEVHDLRLAFEKVSGEDLNWFFDQWFLDKGHPQVRFEVDYSVPENILISAWQEQDVRSSPLYRLPFEVSWYENGQRKSKEFILDQAFQQFALENQAPLRQVYIDEGQDLLFVKKMDLTPSYMSEQWNESEIGVARYEALDSLMAWEAEEYVLELLPQALHDDFWSIREKALQAVQSHPEWVMTNPELEDQIYELAESDAKNSVRAGAIDALGAIDPDKYHNAFQRYAEDSSYLIVSSALMGLMSQSEGMVDSTFIEKFAGENNFRVVIPVAEYYLNEGVSGKGDWFRQKATRLSGEGLYYFLGYYAEYFVQHPEEGEKQALTYLLNLMEHSSQSYVRLGAFQGLMGYADDEEILGKIRDIAALEADENVKSYFEYFLQAFDVEN